jgi:FkbM family methyltransferase
MLIPFDFILKKYELNITGILHVGAHDCEEIGAYEEVIGRDKILWVDALHDKVESCKERIPNVIIEEAIVSDVEEPVMFHRANNGQSSSILEMGLHTHYHPGIDYVESIPGNTQLLKNIICKYDIPYNFINLDIQGAELKALKGMAEYLPSIDYIYSEVNADYVYKDCALITELDDYLATFGFVRVETEWSHAQWGDAFYIKPK